MKCKELENLEYKPSSKLKILIMFWFLKCFDIILFSALFPRCFIALSQTALFSSQLPALFEQ